MEEPRPVHSGGVPEKRGLDVRGRLAASVVNTMRELTRGMSNPCLIDETSLGELDVSSVIHKTFASARARRKRQKRDRREIKRIIIHRLGPKVGVVPEKLIESFSNMGEFQAGSYTDGRFPYCVGVDPWAFVTQYAPILDITPHAAAFNKESIGVFVSGDFRVHPPTWVADIALKKLCVVLAYWIGPGYSIHGHSELGERATGNPDKVCPGGFLDLVDLRRVVSMRVEEMWPFARENRDLILRNYGLVI